MRDASGTFFYVCLCWAEGVMGMAWKEQYGRSSMEGIGTEEIGRYGRDGWNSVQRYNFSLILPNLGV